MWQSLSMRTPAELLAALLYYIQRKIFLELSFFLYHRFGNFCVKKLSYEKFSCKKFFVGTTPYCTSVNSAC